MYKQPWVGWIFPGVWVPWYKQRPIYNGSPSTVFPMTSAPDGISPKYESTRSSFHRHFVCSGTFCLEQINGKAFAYLPFWANSQTKSPERSTSYSFFSISSPLNVTKANCLSGITLAGSKSCSWNARPTNILQPSASRPARMASIPKKKKIDQHTQETQNTDGIYLSESGSCCLNHKIANRNQAL